MFDVFQIIAAIEKACQSLFTKLNYEIYQPSQSEELEKDR